MSKDLLKVEPSQAILGRKLNQETCAKFKVFASTISGEPCVVYPYYSKDGTEMIGQKVRKKDKKFSVLGNISKGGLFGQQLWKNGGKRLVITTGEFDALSYAQASGLTWPVVSIPNGDQSAKKAILDNLDFVESFEEVVLLFDNDAPGQAAAKAVAECLRPGLVKNATLPLKDPSDMLVAKRNKELLQAVWDAKSFRPDGVVDFGDVVAKSLEKPTVGVSLPWSRVSDDCYGLQLGEVYTIGGGSGTGKTDFALEVAAHLWRMKQKIGLILLECSTWETPRRFCGKLDSVHYHIPGCDDSSYMARAEEVAASDLVKVYDNYGVMDWDAIYGKIRWMAAQGHRWIFLDNLTALISQAPDENKEISRVMGQLASCVKELGISIFVMSHLARPQGGVPHEEGARVKLNHFRGSHSIVMWSHNILGLERNQQHDDVEERSKVTLRWLKCRAAGWINGHTYTLKYDAETGRTLECDDFKEAPDVDLDECPFDVGESSDF